MFHLRFLGDLDFCLLWAIDSESSLPFWSGEYFLGSTCKTASFVDWRSSRSCSTSSDYSSHLCSCLRSTSFGLEGDNSVESSLFTTALIDSYSSSLVIICHHIFESYEICSYIHLTTQAIIGILIFLVPPHPSRNTGIKKNHNNPQINRPLNIKN